MTVREDQIVSDIQSLKQRLTNLRKQERNLRDQEALLLKEATRVDYQLANPSAEGFEASLHQVLPPELIPGNIGAQTSALLPYWYQADFDFGLNPTLTPATRQTSSFQITQDAGFLLTSISWDAEDYTTASRLGPYVAEFRDRQSSRLFNNAPVPIQHIGTRSNPTKLIVPMLLMPAAFFDVTVSTFAINQVTVGSGKLQFSFGGLRVMVKDFDKVLSTMFVR